MHKYRLDGLALLILLILPLFWFGPVVFGPRTLLPADNLYTFEPWASHATALGVQVPHNELLSDLILENYAWKRFIRRALRAGELPLWNPYLFTGMPFLAAGQHSALYPLSILFYVLPLWRAYGVFTWLQIALAGINFYLFARVLRMGRTAALLAAIVYAFGGFFIVSVVFTMIIAAAAWLPLLLAWIELIVRKQAEKGDVPFSPVPWVVAGALTLGVQILAGHVEITYYVLLVSAFYALGRLLWLWRRLGHIKRPLHLGVWLLVMVLLGMGLGSVQLIPLYELVQHNFRQGSVGYEQVVGWAWPTRQVLTFFVPDLFGNPSHHGYWDPWLHRWVPATVNALGQPIHTIFWGVKNYVEGGNYVGLLPLLLAVLAIGKAIVKSQKRSGSARGSRFPAEESSRIRGQVQESARGRSSDPPDSGDSQFPILLFALLAALSLAFAFGTPLYALLFYGLPGYKQLHSAFRWVFPLTLSLAVLAGFGLDAMRSAPDRRGRQLSLMLGSGALVVGLGMLAVLAISLVLPGPFIGLGQRVVDGSDLARAAFADGRMFWAYEWGNLLKFGLMLAMAGAVLLWMGANRRTSESASQRTSEPTFHFPFSILHSPSIAVLVLVILDLWLFGHGFNPAVDPHLLDFKPPAIEFLQQASDDGCRFTTFEADARTKTLNANLGWWYNLQDVRGYDSIIPRQYADFMALIEPQGQLLYNRISPFYDPASLDDPLTDLLGVCFVVSETELHNPGWEEVYREEVFIYRNQDAIPRALVLPQARAVVPSALPQVLTSGVDFRHELLLEADQGPDPLPPAGGTGSARLSEYGLRQLLVDVDADGPAWLLLTDAYFPGWKAYLRPLGSGEEAEQPLPIYRADGNFRAVYLPQAGRWTVRFVYSPRSVQLGIYISFLAGVTLLLLAGWWSWGRFYRERDDVSEVHTVAKNSLVPMALSLLNKGIDFAFAMLRLRILRPEGEGSYAFAIAFYGFFEILVRFGLGTLLTRDVAQDRQQAGRYLANVVVLRTLLWLLSLPLMTLVGAAYAVWGGLTVEEAWAIGLFAIALFFASMADAISAVFYAFEKMEYPAGLASAIATAKVALGALVLLIGWGFVGLAGVSVVMNLVQTVWLYWLLREKAFRPARPLRREVDWGLQREMLVTSGPLMINHLLASIFWRIDVWILKPVAGAAAVGIYSAGVKYLDGLNVIPAYFTLAIFPLMSRYARGQHESLVRAYRVAVRLLVMMALPIAVLVTFIAAPLIQVLGGERFLPDSAIALQILIWSIPVGFINSVTQYVLIAVDQQRFLTKAFIIGVVFNSVGNLIFIPMYGYRAAAVITILSEFSLFFPFYWCVRRHVAPMPWVALLWRPAVAATAMGGVLWLLAERTLAGGIVLSSFVYIAVLIGLGSFRDPDMRVLLKAIPVQRWLSAATTESHLSSSKL